MNPISLASKQLAVSYGLRQLNLIDIPLEIGSPNTANVYTDKLKYGLVQAALTEGLTAQHKAAA